MSATSQKQYLPMPSNPAAVSWDDAATFATNLTTMGWSRRSALSTRELQLTKSDPRYSERSMYTGVDPSDLYGDLVSEIWVYPSVSGGRMRVSPPRSSTPRARPTIATVRARAGDQLAQAEDIAPASPARSRSRPSRARPGNAPDADGIPTSRPPIGRGSRGQPRNTDSEIEDAALLDARALASHLLSRDWAPAADLSPEQQQRARAHPNFAQRYFWTGTNPGDPFNPFVKELWYYGPERPDYMIDVRDPPQRAEPRSRVDQDGDDVIAISETADADVLEYVDPDDNVTYTLVESDAGDGAYSLYGDGELVYSADVGDLPAFSASLLTRPTNKVSASAAPKARKATARTSRRAAARAQPPRSQRTTARVSGPRITRAPSIAISDAEDGYDFAIVPPRAQLLKPRAGGGVSGLVQRTAANTVNAAAQKQIDYATNIVSHIVFDRLKNVLPDLTSAKQVIAGIFRRPGPSLPMPDLGAFNEASFGMHFQQVALPGGEIVSMPIPNIIPAFDGVVSAQAIAEPIAALAVSTPLEASAPIIIETSAEPLLALLAGETSGPAGLAASAGVDVALTATEAAAALADTWAAAETAAIIDAAAAAPTGLISTLAAIPGWGWIAAGALAIFGNELFGSSEAKPSAFGVIDDAGGLRFSQNDYTQGMDDLWNEASHVLLHGGIYDRSQLGPHLGYRPSAATPVLTMASTLDRIEPARIAPLPSTWFTDWSARVIARSKGADAGMTESFAIAG